MLLFTLLFSVLCFAMATPASLRGSRIVGGEVASIESYPYMAAVLYGTIIFSHTCGSSILNIRSFLTAARCFWFDRNPVPYRIRVGSSFANAGGIVYTTSQIIEHPNYGSITHDSDLAIIRSDGVITFNDFVMPAAIAGTNYNLRDNQAVWTVGWGLTESFGSPSEILRHVQIWNINQDICKSRLHVTDGMLCVGVLDIGGKGACVEDTGGPLVHNGVVVGVFSWQNGCGNSYYPDIYTRVSNFTSWIQANA